MKYIYQISLLKNLPNFLTSNSRDLSPIEKNAIQAYTGGPTGTIGDLIFQEELPIFSMLRTAFMISSSKWLSVLKS